MPWAKRLLRSPALQASRHEGGRHPEQRSREPLCGGSHVREDGTIAATAFMPRPGEPYLSVNWLELLGLTTRADEAAEVLRVLSTKRKIGTTARLAVLNVGVARDGVRGQSHDHRKLSFRHEPELDAGRPQDPSHSAIYGVPEDDNLIAELLAAAVAEIHGPH